MSDTQDMMDSIADLLNTEYDDCDVVDLREALLIMYVTISQSEGLDEFEVSEETSTMYEQYDSSIDRVLH